MRKFLLFSVILHKLSHFKMKKGKIYIILWAMLFPFVCQADILPTAIYTEKDGTEVSKTEDFTEEAPLHVRFEANASFLDEGSTLEWHFRHQGANGMSNITRYEENTEYDFTESGLTEVSLIVKIKDEVVDSAGIRITISESHLEMPNAFSPNNDGTNDIYGAKGSHDPDCEGRYRSIVEFHAYIFNRWGQKLYEWTDINGGWDGTFHGSPVKDGVYFVVVKARGADGIEYNIRRDVNLIRNFNVVSSSTEGGNE